MTWDNVSSNNPGGTVNIDRTYEALDGLRSSLPRLRDALVPGTPRRWTERTLTDEQADRMNALAQIERQAKEINLAMGIKALGTGRAPLRIEVLDVEIHTVIAVTELEGAVCDRFGLTVLDGATTSERITRIIGLLDRIAAAEDLAGHVHAEAARLHRQARQALDEDEPVHRIKGRCPFCGSVSLRAFPEREVIVCVSPTCRCDDEECPCNSDRPRRHKWLYAQWEGLAATLTVGPHAQTA